MKPLTKQQRSDNEQFRYDHNHSYDVKQLIESIPNDHNLRVTQDYATAAEANEVRMALYNLRRTVRSFKYFRPDIDDKIARFKASVQGTTLILRLRPGRGIDDLPKPVNQARVEVHNQDAFSTTTSEPELRSLADAFEFPAETPQQPAAPDPDEGFEFPIRKRDAQ